MGGLPLFPDLPDPPPRIVEPADPELPSSLKRLLANGAPHTAITKLLLTLPGRVVSVPAADQLRDRHELVRALGMDDATAIAKALPGWPTARLAVPRGVKMLRAVRNEAIRRDLDADRPMAEICLEHQVTERWVKVLGKRE